MDIVVIKEFKEKFWEVAEVWINEKQIATINKFYDVTPDWIYIYETVGGSGIGWKAGSIKEKIFIGDCELKVIKQ